MKNFLLLIAIIAVGYAGWTQYWPPPSSVWHGHVTGTASTGNAEFANALETRSSGV